MYKLLKLTFISLLILCFSMSGGRPYHAARTADSQEDNLRIHAIQQQSIQLSARKH